jgi:RNA polymerase sigma-70 factor (ECF subfamily)
MRDLVERAMKGDRDAFTALAIGINADLFAISRRILHDVDLAEEAVQQCLLQIWRQLPALRDPNRFQAWSYRLLVNACYRQARHERRRAPNLRVLSEERAGRDHAGEVADRDELERAFHHLSPEHRAVVVLHHYRGMPQDEVASVLEIPVGTVYSRLHYAYRDMRATLEADARPGRSATA